MQPIGKFSRKRKPAMALRLCVIIAFWPVIWARAAAASSKCFFSVMALPTPMLTTIFSSRGSERRFVRPSFSAKSRQRLPSRTASKAGAMDGLPPGAAAALVSAFAFLAIDTCFLFYLACRLCVACSLCDSPCRYPLVCVRFVVFFPGGPHWGQSRRSPPDISCSIDPCRRRRGAGRRCEPAGRRRCRPTARSTGDGHLLRQPAALRVARAAADVPIDAIDSLDDELALVRSTFSTLPRVPRSSPVITSTVSSTRICITPPRWRD